MTNQEVTISLITDIADAIREVTGTTDKLTLAQMPNAIEGKSGSISGTYVGKSGLESIITAIGNSIRTAGDTTAKLTLAQMPNAIRSIKPTPEKAIAAIDAVWNTDAMWSTIAKYGDTVRENPDAFSKYVGMTATYSHGSYGSQQVRVVDIAHYDRSDGKGKAAFVFDHVGIPVTHYMNPTSGANYSYYKGCAMKTFLDGEFYNGMPTILKNAIVSAKVLCSKDSDPNNTTNFEALDCKLFLFAATEIFGGKPTKEGTRIAWYAANNTNAARNKKYNGSGYNWWLRTPRSTQEWYEVFNNGSSNYHYAQIVIGASPGFNVG